MLIIEKISTIVPIGNSNIITTVNTIYKLIKHVSRIKLVNFILVFLLLSIIKYTELLFYITIDIVKKLFSKPDVFFLIR